MGSIIQITNVIVILDSDTDINDKNELKLIALLQRTWKYMLI